MDSREAGAVEAGDLLLAEREGRFKSLGLGVEDIATARLAVGRARAGGVGTEVAL